MLDPLKTQNTQISNKRRTSDSQNAAFSCYPTQRLDRTNPSTHKQQTNQKATSKCWIFKLTLLTIKVKHCNCLDEQMQLFVIVTISGKWLQPLVINHCYHWWLKSLVMNHCDFCLINITIGINGCNSSLIIVTIGANYSNP